MLVAQAADGPRPGRHLRGWPTQTRDGCEASARVLSGPQTGEGTRLGRNEILAHLDLRCPFRPVQLLYPKCYRPSCCSGSGRTHCSLYLGLDRRSPPVFRPASRPTPQTAQKMGLRGQDEATVFGFETSGATSGASTKTNGCGTRHVPDLPPGRLGRSPTAPTTALHTLYPSFLLTVR